MARSDDRGYDPDGEYWADAADDAYFEYEQREQCVFALNDALYLSVARAIAKAPAGRRRRVVRLAAELEHARLGAAVADGGVVDKVGEVEAEALEAEWQEDEDGASLVFIGLDEWAQRVLSRWSARVTQNVRSALSVSLRATPPLRSRRCARAVCASARPQRIPAAEPVPSRPAGPVGVPLLGVVA